MDEVIGTYYRNRETGYISWHPVSGLGDTFNAEEVGENGKPILPLGSSAETTAKAVKTAHDTKGAR